MTRRRSFTSEYKLKTVNYAKEFGNAAAARFFEGNEKQVRNWKFQENCLKVCPRFKRVFRGRKPKWKFLEAELRQWVLSEREKEGRVTTVGILFKARELVKKQ